MSWIVAVILAVLICENSGAPGRQHERDYSVDHYEIKKK